jgi:hypothetical protein
MCHDKILRDAAPCAAPQDEVGGMRRGGLVEPDEPIGRLNFRIFTGAAIAKLESLHPAHGKIANNDWKANKFLILRVSCHTLGYKNSYQYLVYEFEKRAAGERQMGTL